MLGHIVIVVYLISNHVFPDYNHSLAHFRLYFYLSKVLVGCFVLRLGLKRLLNKSISQLSEKLSFSF